MNHITELAERRLQRRAPGWKVAVTNAERDGTDYLMTTLDAFAGEPQLLYDALIYARNHNVTVLLVPTVPEDAVV